MDKLSNDLRKAAQEFLATCLIQGESPYAWSVKNYSVAERERLTKGLRSLQAVLDGDKPRLNSYNPKESKAMTKYRKKPVVIEAHQWFKNGDHPEDDCKMVPREHDAPFKSEGKVVRYYRRPDVNGEAPCKHCGVRMHDHGWIDTLEAGHNVCPGDWIITGVKGERYPCKPDIFEATYEPA